MDIRTNSTNTILGKAIYFEKESYPFFPCQIYSNGDVSFCACPDFDINDEFKVGYIKEKDLTSIYNSNECRELWNFDNGIPNYCKYCTFHTPISDIEDYCEMIKNPIDYIGG